MTIVTPPLIVLNRQRRRRWPEVILSFHGLEASELRLAYIIASQAFSLPFSRAVVPQAHGEDAFVGFAVMPHSSLSACLLTALLLYAD